GVAANVDSESFAGLGVLDVPVTMAHNGVEGESAYMLRGGSRFAYSLLGQHGRLAPFDVAMRGTAGDVAVVRGQVAKTRASVAATGPTGAVLNLGQVQAGQFLYAALHLFGVGTTITALIESDDAAGMATPSTRITFGPLTTTGGFWGARVAGPLTDTHYRLNITAITGSFDVACLIGIR
ncbi:MAG TPA: hypothetical protein VFM37_04670, partial [Pseudonocardiaceae bacterium]|nr:hypothetical protein [Pseudonocardiaceae bacterium]